MFQWSKKTHKIRSVGELNATEIPQNIIEMFVVRVYFVKFGEQFF